MIPLNDSTHNSSRASQDDERTTAIGQLTTKTGSVYHTYVIVPHVHRNLMVIHYVDQPLEFCAYASGID